MRFDRDSHDEGGSRIPRPTLGAFRYVVVVFVAVTVASPVIGAAATIGLGPESLAVGRSSIARCDSNGFTVAYTTVGGNVTAANVGGVADPGCEGGQLQITLIGGGGGVLGTSSSVTVPTDGDTVENSVGVSFSSPQPDGELVSEVHVAVTGP
jgi:hypothetical protein